MTAGITLTLSAIIVLFPKLLLSMFVRKPEILEIGIGYLRTLGFAYILFALMFVSNGVINGSGRTLVTMAITVLSNMADQDPACRTTFIHKSWHKWHMAGRGHRVCSGAGCQCRLLFCGPVEESGVQTKAIHRIILSVPCSAGIVFCPDDQ